jgi:hypothetical protein
MRSWLLVVLVACGPTPPAQDPDTPKNCLAAPTVQCFHTSLEYYANTMCQCSTKSCATDTDAEMQKWGAEIAKVAPKEDKPDPAAEQRSREIVDRYKRCLTERMTKSKQGGW